VALVTLMWARTVAAGVMLDVNLMLNDQKVTESQLITDSGKEAEIGVNDLLKVMIVPTLRADGKVFLELRVFEFNGSDYVPAFSPKLLTNDNVAAEIITTTDRGNRFRLRITPHELGR
jgi:hypothetical protein